LSSAIQALQSLLDKERHNHGNTEERLRRKSDVMREEQEKMVTFVMKMESRDQQISDDVIDKMEEGQLRQVFIFFNLKLQDNNQQLNCSVHDR
jgi:hypothetical protein